MALDSYYERFYIQELVKVPSSDELYQYQDGTKIMGLFRQIQSSKTAMASSQGIATFGIFATKSSIKNGSILRRASDGIYIKLIGDPLTSAKLARIQVKTWESRIISRTEVTE